MMMSKTIVIDGYRIHDIPTFYDEVNRSFMSGEDWKLGPSLDALDDMLYGGYGAIRGNEPVQIFWKNFEQNERDLGVEATRQHYRQKLNHPDIFNVSVIKRKLDELENGTGKTYFEIILEIISDHKNIELVV